MPPSVRHAAFAALLVVAGCSSKPAARIPDAGTPGTAGSGAGRWPAAGGADAPDAAAGTGGGTPDAPGGAGGGPTDAGPERRSACPASPSSRRTSPGSRRSTARCCRGRGARRSRATPAPGSPTAIRAGQDDQLDRQGRDRGDVRAGLALRVRRRWPRTLRDAKLMINGVPAADAVASRTPPTGTTGRRRRALEVQLAAGSNFIQLQAIGRERPRQHRLHRDPRRRASRPTTRASR